MLEVPETGILSNGQQGASKVMVSWKTMGKPLPTLLINDSCKYFPDELMG